MPSGASVEILPSELAQIVVSVFEAMLGLQVSESETPWFSSGDRLTSVVHLAGDWNGAVLVECDRGQACRFAGRFLTMEPPETVDDVVRDVLGELANMIGGNLKCGMPTGVRLSMPTVMEGRDYDMRICGSQVLERVAFECAEGHFWVTVLVTKE